MKIAQALSADEFRVIRLLDGEPEVVARLLCNFYTDEQRIEALLDLGTLGHLGATPYKKYIPERCEGCISYRRDTYGTPEKHGAITESLSELKDSDDLVFLYENGAWYICLKERREPITRYGPLVIPKVSELPVDVYSLSVDGFRPDRNKVVSWAEIQAQADKDGRTRYVFRNHRLAGVLTPINNYVKTLKI